MDRDRSNPYAPPATTAAPAADELQSTSGGGEGASPHRPARLLWPHYLLAMCSNFSFYSFFRWSIHAMHQRHSDITSGYLVGFSGLGASVVAGPVVGLLGDGRAARPLLLCSLLLLAAATLGTLAPSSGPALSALTHGVGQIGSICAALVVTALILRGVTVRGVYLAMMLLTLVRNTGSFLSGPAGSLVAGNRGGLLIGAGGALLAAVFVAWVRAPQAATVPEEVDDPLLRSPLPSGTAVVMVLLLGGYAALAGTFEPFGKSLVRLGEVGLPEYLDNLSHLPSILGLFIPILAFRGRWRPRNLVAAGMAVTAVGGAAVGASVLLGSELGCFVGLAGLAAVSLGHDVMFNVGSAALLRQNLPVERMALWWAAYMLAGSLLRHAVFVPAGWLAPSHYVSGAAGLMVPIIVGLWLLLRGR